MENPTDNYLRSSLIEKSNDTFVFNVSKDPVEITQHDLFLQQSLKLSDLKMSVAYSYIGSNQWVRHIEYVNQYPKYYQ